MTRPTIIHVLLGLCLVLSSCGNDPDTPVDMGSGDPDMPVAAADMGTGDANAADMAKPDMAGPDDPSLCEPCESDDECGATGDLCLSIVEGEQFCSQACDEGSPCPADFFCGLLDEMAGIQQCIPDNLTCVDRCSTVSCTGNETCDPLTGECRRPLRLCETGCVLSTMCGDGPEDVCLNIPNTPDQERSCLTGCNPEAETPECPADFFCASLDPENDPQRGVCFPFDGTCVDRCADVDCPAGRNCDPVSGQCSAAQFGACDAGCTNSTQCGGQQDLCLDLGIGDGPHCWQECTESECPGGYDCRSLLGTTIRVCIPLGNDCSACYDNACYPDGVCNPVDDLCESLPTPCGIDADCGVGELCNPISNACVAIGRPCNGSTWAVDCDNAVTKCTSQRAGIDGTCEQTCLTDADCLRGTCTETNLGRLCLDNLGGAATCGTINDVATTVGGGCNPGTCRGSTPTCIDGGNINAFCSRSCTSDASCTGEQVCRPASGANGSYCLDANCRCAASPSLISGDLALDTVLAQLGLSQCALGFEDIRYEDLPQLATPIGSEWLSRRVEYPIAGMGLVSLDASSLDGASNLSEALSRASNLAGIDLTPMVRNFTYPGVQGPLAQAIGELVAAAGGTPDLAALDAAVAAVPITVQLAAAPVVSAAALGVTARSAAALNHFGGGVPTALFAGAPFAFLPADSAQAAVALAPSNAADRQTLSSAEAFARELVASSDFVGQLPDAVGALASLGGQTFPMVSIDTPAGRVVIASSGNDTHDAAAHGTDIAVLIDLGGDDSYTIPAGANASTDNGVSILIDLAGADTYGYVAAPDPSDGTLLVSDVDGRIASTLPLNQANGPVSASNVARQGSGRLGIGILVDLGPGQDTYRSLRMSQGASVFGLGMLYDDGPVVMTSEALSQGAAIGGIGVLWAENATNDDFKIWHAGQGFGTFGGAGLAYDRGGDDQWFADPGTSGTVLYLSTADRGVSNRNLAQGAAFGEVGVFGGGLGMLRDASGADNYDTGTFGQGYGRGIAFGALADGGGNDTYNGRGLVQGVGEWRGAGALRDSAGSDNFNQSATQRLVGQGVGQTLGWGAFVDLGGNDAIQYLPSGGGVGIDGGVGLAINVGGNDTHIVASDASWGFAQIAANVGEPGYDEITLGIFLDSGASTDTYSRPTLTGVGDGGAWGLGAAAPLFSNGVDD